MAMPFPSPNTPPDGDNHHPSVLDKLFSSAGPHLAPRLQHAQSKLTAHSYGAQLDTALRSSSSSLGARARRVSGRLDALHAGWGGAVEAAADKYASKLAGAGIEARVDSVAKRVGEALGSVEHRLGYGQAQQQQHHQQQQQQQPDPPVFPPPPGTPARQQQQRPEPQQQQQQLGAAAGAGAGAVGAGAHDPPRSPRIELVEPRVGPAQQFDSPPGSPPRAPLGLKHGQQHPPEPAPAPTQSTHGTPLQPPAQPAPSAPSPSVLAPHRGAAPAPIAALSLPLAPAHPPHLAGPAPPIAAAPPARPPGVPGSADSGALGPAPPGAPRLPPAPSLHPNPTSLVSPVIDGSAHDNAACSAAPEAPPPPALVGAALSQLGSVRTPTADEQGRVPSNNSDGALSAPNLVPGLDADRPAAVYAVPRAPDAPVVHVPNTVEPPAAAADPNPARDAGRPPVDAAPAPALQVGGGGRLAGGPTPTPAPQLDVQPRTQDAPAPNAASVPHLAGPAVVPDVAGGADHPVVGGVSHGHGQFDDAEEVPPPYVEIDGHGLAPSSEPAGDTKARVNVE